MLPRKGALMKGLVITTENKMQVREFGEPAYETIGKAVGGWIEVVHPKGLPDPFCIDRKSTRLNSSHSSQSRMPSSA